MFLYELHRSGVTIERMKNKQRKVYGLKFTYGGHSFKASEIGREFGSAPCRSSSSPATY